jgi:lipid-binding SYLF domain-containing protein
MIKSKVLASQSRRAALAVLVAGALAACASDVDRPASPSEPEALVADARTTLSNFLRDPDQTWIQDNLDKAKAVLIAPKIVKAGFIFGGSGGRCVFVVKTDKGWNGPAFYATGTASAGFQAGVDVSQIIGLFMTQKAVDSMMSAEFKLTGNASVSAGPVGVGTAATPNADIIYYSRSKGLYGGVDLSSAVIKPSADYNNAYFGKDVSPIDILVKGAVHSKEASPLIAKVTKLYGK